MSSRTYGYVRVSSREQRVDRQMIAMRDFGVAEECIIVENRSGKNFDRPAYLHLVENLQERDVLVIKSIDRLGRNYDEILEQWTLLTRKKLVDIVVLDMPLLDTHSDRDLTGALIADIVLQILSYVAQTEREFNHQRQAEGIAAAKARGVRFGRKRLPVPKDFEDYVEEWHRGHITAVDAGKELGISRTTFTCRAKEWRMEMA